MLRISRVGGTTLYSRLEIQDEHDLDECQTVIEYDPF